MDKLFGVPVGQLLTVLLAIFGFGTGLLLLSALRNRVAFKMAIRNVPRRRAQTALIVLGLMLATLLFSASFATGDTLTNSFRSMAIERLGEVDVQVQADGPSPMGMQMAGGSGTRLAYFDEQVMNQVRGRLEGDEQVAGVAPLVVERAAVRSPKTGLSEPQTDVLGIDDGAMRGFDRPVNVEGRTLSIAGLRRGQAYISADLASDLDTGRGGKVEAYLGSQPFVLEVAGVYVKGANPAGVSSIVVPLSTLQQITGNEGRINSILITHEGPALEGGAHTASTINAIQPLLREHGLVAKPVKKDAVEQADEGGQQFASMFVMLGQFSIAAGILLIFLIFVMLAAERKRELGIARSIGMQRGHLVRMFTYEGAIYALVASAVGSLLGVAVGWAMVRVIGVVFGRFDELGELNITFALRPTSVALAFLMGMVLTFAIVLVASWRVSRLNVIRAIRDIPEPEKQRNSVKGWMLAILMPVLGALMFLAGLQAESLSQYMLGSSLLIVGLALLTRRLRVPDRVAFTTAGAGLLAWWLMPAAVSAKLTPEGMSQGIEMFFISGVMIVLGAVWVLVYNADILLSAIVAVFGLVKGLPPVLKTAVKYPMQSRFRTGMTLAMFSLVVFTIVLMGFITTSMGGSYDDPERVSGGYDLRASAGYANPISDMSSALESAKGVDPDTFSAVGSLATLPVRASQEGASGKRYDVTLQGADPGYTGSVRQDFEMTAEGYRDSREVWEALEHEPDTAIVAASLVRSRSDGQPSGMQSGLTLAGVYKEDGTIPQGTALRVENPRTGATRNLRVIGVLERSASFNTDVVTSKASLDHMAGTVVRPQTYMFRLKDGADATESARVLERAFVANGLQVGVVADEVRDSAQSGLMLSNLLTGFMGLGLIVGIAALGVIAARSVVERRQQIGMMRALGFQQRQVLLAFLMESSFIALLGIATGVALGFGLSGKVIEQISGATNVTYQVPWTLIALTAIVAYGASLLTTFLPARQASKVYPAEALRYE